MASFTVSIAQYNAPNELAVVTDYVHMFGGKVAMPGWEQWGSVSLRIDGATVVFSGTVESFKAYAALIANCADKMEALIADRDVPQLPLPKH